MRITYEILCIFILITITQAKSIKNNKEDKVYSLLNTPPIVKTPLTIEEIYENSETVITKEFAASYLYYLLNDKTLTEQISNRITVNCFTELLRKYYVWVELEPLRSRTPASSSSSSSDEDEDDAEVESMDDFTEDTLMEFSRSIPEQFRKRVITAVTM